MSGGLPAITPDSFKTHLRAEQRLADAAAGKVELVGDEAAKLKASMLSSAQIAALSTMNQHTDFNDLAKINRMTAFLAGGSMTGLPRARTRRPWRAAHI